jgi:tetrahydromethanopterin S-methyltransferase subunit B
MGIVRVSPELHLLFDPLGGVISEERDDVVQFALDPIMAHIDDMNKIADDLMNSLGPTAELMTSYPGRERTSFIAGIYTNIWYGFIVGLVIAALMLAGSYLKMRGGV